MRRIESDRRLSQRNAKVACLRVAETSKRLSTGLLFLYSTTKKKLVKGSRVSLPAEGSVSADSVHEAAHEYFHHGKVP